MSKLKTNTSTLIDSRNYGVRTIRRRTIRRGQFGATIRRGQFGANDNINFLKKSSFHSALSFRQSSFHFSNNFYQSSFHFSNILFINPVLFQQYSSRQSRFHFSSIFHQSRFNFSNLLLINPASISVIFFINRASISAKFFHQFITVTHNVLYQMGLLIEYTKLYTVIHYNQLIQDK